MPAQFQHIFNDPSNRFSIDYVRRKGHFSMPINHFHNFYELYYLCEGERISFINDRTYPVKAGNIVLINRNALHRTLDTGIPNHERLVVYIQHDWIEASYPEHSHLLLNTFNRETPVLSFPANQATNIRRMVADLTQEMLIQEPGFAIRIQHTVIDLLLIAARSSKIDDPAPLELQSPIHAKITKIIRFLNDHYAEAITLPELADRFSMSPYYLSRTFKLTTGFTFSEYLNLVRLKEAQRLLRETKLKITDISLLTGFENFSHFGKAFKKLTELSPRAYRRQS